MNTEPQLSMPVPENPVFGAIGHNPHIEFYDRVVQFTPEVVKEAEGKLILLLNEDDPGIAEAMKNYFVVAVGGKLILKDAKHRFQSALALSTARDHAFPSWIAISGKLGTRDQIDMKHIWLINEADAVLFAMEYAAEKEAANGRL